MSDIPADEMLAALERIRDVVSRSERAGALDEVRSIAQRVLDGRGGSDVLYCSDWLTQERYDPRVDFFVSAHSFLNPPPENAVAEHRNKQNGVHSNWYGSSPIGYATGDMDLRRVRIWGRGVDGKRVDDAVLAAQEGKFELVFAQSPAEERPFSACLGSGVQFERHWHVQPLEQWHVRCHFVDGWRGPPVLLTCEITGRRTQRLDFLNEQKFLRAMRAHRLLREEIEGLLGD